MVTFRSRINSGTSYKGPKMSRSPLLLQKYCKVQLEHALDLKGVESFRSGNFVTNFRVSTCMKVLLLDLSIGVYVRGGRSLEYFKLSFFGG